MKLLALDYGSARTGVAVSDPSGVLARPLSAIPRVGSPDGMAALLAILGEERPDRIVVGLPRTPSGDEGAQAGATRAFVGRLRRLTPIPIDLEDERFTTSIAQSARRSGARADLDSAAAAVLLQGVLDRTAGPAAPSS